MTAKRMLARQRPAIAEIAAIAEIGGLAGLAMLAGVAAMPLGGCGDDSNTDPDSSVPDAGAVDSSVPDSSVDASPGDVNTRPAFVIESSIVKTYYDGESDDLLTAGLGTAGLQGGTPGYADPANPTAAELRRHAIYANFRALHDFTSDGGFGRIFGPNLDAEGNDTGTQGLVPGWEYLAYADDGSGQEMVTMMVQIPDSFDPDAPCLVTGPSSGSRGVYGAIGTSGNWGLKRGCAVVYTDIGKGTGFHNLQTGTVRGMRGERLSAGAPEANFSAALTAEELAELNEDRPNRYAVKHVHSQRNPEKDWGRLGLEAVTFAFYVLNEHFFAASAGPAGTPYRIQPENTLVLAAGVSNGGSVVLHMAEQDTRGLIDAVVAAEPNVQPQPGQAFAIAQGATLLDSSVHGKPLLDYQSFLNLYQPCASLAEENQNAPVVIPLDAATNAARCASLHDNGLLDATELAAQAEEALQRINDYGINPEQNHLQPLHQSIEFPQSIAVGYVQAYGRYSVKDHVCGFSYGAVDGSTGVPVALSEQSDALLFATSNGLPATGGVGIIYDDAVGGPIDHRRGTSPLTGRADQSFDGALCLRQATLEDARVQAGMAEVHHTAALHGLPAIIVTGRADAVISINHASRPYYASNLLAEGDQSQLRYYEVLHAHHLDVFNARPGLSDKYVPLYYYFEQSLNAMWNRLQSGTPLAPSQVVRTVPRGSQDGVVPALDEALHLPPIAGSPAQGDLITFADGVLTIPE